MAIVRLVILGFAQLKSACHSARPHDDVVIHGLPGFCMYARSLN